MKNIILLGLIFSQTLLAQNLLPNGNFDNDISGWENLYPNDFQMLWVANDGKSNNGSLEISTPLNDNAVNTVRSQVISVVQDQTYHLQGWAKPSVNTDTNSAVVWIELYDENNLLTEVVQSLYVLTSNANGDWGYFEGDFQFSNGTKNVRILLGVEATNNTNSTPSSARFDDLRFSLGAAGSNFAMVAGHSALWYDPNQSGHGINVYLLGSQRVLVYWYVYDNQGNPLWLLGLGTHDGFKATLDVNLNSGALFPPNFDSVDVNTVPWGKFELEFNDCDSGVFKWIPNAGNGFTAGQMNITRLITTEGLTCNN